MNQTKGSQIEVFYWKEGDQEVDFILRHGESLTAIAVKSNGETLKHSGMDFFVKKFHPNRIVLVGDSGIPLEQFLQAPLSDFV